MRTILRKIHNPLFDRLKPRAVKTSFNPVFRGSNLVAQTITDKEWLLSGAAETGKTFAGLWRLHNELKRNANTNNLLVRKTRASLLTTAVKTYERLLRLAGDDKQVKVYGGASPKWYIYPNGSILYLVGLDDPTKILSGEFDYIYINQAEELNLSDWETVSTRNTGRGAVTKTPMLFGDCNPGAPSHWIKRRPTLNLLETKHTDNPTLYDELGTITEQGERSLAVLHALTGVRKERLLHGRWVQAEGAIYPFDQTIHLLDRFPIPSHWRKICSIDLGYTNPFVCQWWAIDEDERMYLYREIYMSGRIIEEHAKDILSFGDDVDYYVSDHDAEDRATLETHGVITNPANKTVKDGIQAVQERLRVQGDGKPRLFILRDSLVERDYERDSRRQPVCTLDEFDNYVWETSKNGEKNEKEEPRKLDDHGMDAMRYAVMSLQYTAWVD